MLTVAYEKVIPYPYAAVVSQYFDYKHIAHVHPRTLGEYRTIESTASRIVYAQTWPAGWGGRRARSTVEHTWTYPGDMQFRFVAGRYKGVRVRTRLEPQGADTRVIEAYDIPLLPNWRWLARLAKPLVLDVVERVWEEDLRVEVCRDGWPGVPGVPPAHAAAAVDDDASGEHDSWPCPTGPVDAYELGTPRVVSVGRDEVLVVRRPNRWVAVSNRCPHAQGPLSLGVLEEEHITCPWHGARFALATGESMNAVTACCLATYVASVSGGQLMLAPGHPVTGTAER